MSLYYLKEQVELTLVGKTKSEGGILSNDKVRVCCSKDINSEMPWKVFA